MAQIGAIITLGLYCYCIVIVLLLYCYCIFCFLLVVKFGSVLLCIFVINWY